MDQPLGRRDDGRYAPIGGWSITDVRVHPARDVARRIGDVPEDPPPPVSFPGAPGQGRGDSDGLGRDETDVRYLPRDVRSGFVAALPRPTLAVAEAVRFSEGDRVTHHVVNALRLDDIEADVANELTAHDSAIWRTVWINDLIDAGTFHTVPASPTTFAPYVGQSERVVAGGP